jgi:indolepyruvate ferredoxin oxidoreductase
MKVDSRFLKEEGWEVYTGNELLVKGLLETEGGSHLWTGYPGSPVAGFFDCIESIQELPRQYGIHAFMANNEALSVAALNGSQMAGLRGIAVMKSVGVHVASDSLALGNLAGAHPEGGALVVLGDDPWNDSTQVPSDSRYLCKHMHMPVLEPSTLQELKDWINLGFKLSRESELYLGYLVTTNLADGGGSVQTRRNHFPRTNTHQRFELDTKGIDLEKGVLLPPRTSVREAAFTERYERLWASARRHGANRLDLPRPCADAGRAPLVFVTSALAYTYLTHALDQMGVLDQFPILKVGITYPLDPSLIEPLKDLTGTLVVVEERRGFLEEQIAQLITSRELPFKLYGKSFPGRQPGIPDKRGLNPSVLIELLGPWIQEMIGAGIIRQTRETVQKPLDRIADTATFDIQLVPRTPTFCPGCPHRDSASVLIDIKKEFRDPSYMRRKHRRGPVDLLFHGDTGCYTMLMFEPTKDLMHNYSGMGLGGGTGMGIDPFITNKQVVFMGDGTFFHSGQVAISNSVKNGQDITYIILDNKTTAMTGHQPTAGTETDICGNTTYTQSIDKIVESMMAEGRVQVVRVNPEMREHYRTILEDTILRDGVKVIVADKECGITYHRRIAREERAVVKEKGYLPFKRHINITPEVCEYCLECTTATGCPGLTFTETDFGRKVQTDLSWCVSDTACTKLYACPSFEELTVVRTQKPEKLFDHTQLRNLPQPAVPSFDNAWHCYLAGVGGMGIATSTATLVRAAYRQGYRVIFCDKNGLAIRNGGVYSQLTFLKGDEIAPYSPLIPYGMADLILGLDPLEAARGLDPANIQRVGHPDRTAAVINSHKTPTILTLMGKDDFCVDALSDMIRRHTRSDRFFAHNLSALSESCFGTKLYVNIMLLGVAYQAGLLPLTLENLEWGIRETMAKAFQENWQAFNLGRKVYLDAQAKGPAPAARTYHDVVAEKTALFRQEGPRGKRLAQTYWRMVTQAVERIRLDPENLRLLALRIYDLIRYEDTTLAQDYIDRVSGVFQRDLASKNYEATKAVLWNLHRVMAIKDEIYVAYLLTSPEKYERDRERYLVHPELGDRIIYRHLNRPEFDIFGIRIRFKIRTQDWMLRTMARMKFLRRLMPGWHGRERAFRDWYLSLVNAFQPATHHRYDEFVRILRAPESVTGYREVRYPKMEETRRRIDAEMAAWKSVSDTEAVPAGPR